MARGQEGGWGSFLGVGGDGDIHFQRHGNTTEGSNRAHGAGFRLRTEGQTGRSAGFQPAFVWIARSAVMFVR
jgi:hypothetical protein